MTSPNLAVPHIAAGQNQKEVTANEAFDRLDLALTGSLTVDCTAGGTITVTLDQTRHNARFVLEGTPAAPFTFRPAKVRRFMAVRNTTGQTATVSLDDAGNTVEVEDGQHLLLYSTGAGNTVFLVGAAGGGAGSFLALADTPASFAGQAGRLAAVDGAETGLAFVDPPAAAGSHWAVPFRGALVRRTTAQTGMSFPQAVTWQTAVYDTDGLWDDAQPTRLTVPHGVTRVRLIGGVELPASTSAGSLTVTLMINGTTAPTLGRSTWRSGTTGFNTNRNCSQTPVLAVAAGDQIELNIAVSGLGSPTSVTAEPGTFLALEIVETDQAQAPSFTGLLADTPEDYAGHAYNPVVVDGGEEGVAFADNVHFRGGRMGIGTDDPQHRLHIVDNTVAETRLQRFDTAGLALRSTGNVSQIESYRTTAGTLLFDISLLTEAASGAELRLFRSTSTTGARKVVLFKGDDTTTQHGQIGVDGQHTWFGAGGGNFGIGAVPGVILDVQRNNQTLTARLRSTTDHAAIFAGDANRASGNATLVALSGRWNGTEVGRIRVVSGSSTAAKDDGRLTFGTKVTGEALDDHMVLTEEGRLGLGELEPAERLHLDGNLRVDGEVMVGAAVAIDQDGVHHLPEYTVATAPDAGAKGAGAVIFVANGAEGEPVLAFSDGTSWLRADTRAIISAT